MSQRLANYLLTHRRHAGLSQDEVGFLVGGKSGAGVSRYERSRRLPSFETALAYEVVFGVPARQLFPGIFAKVEKATNKRAEILAAKVSDSAKRKLQLRDRKLETLEQVRSSRRS